MAPRVELQTLLEEILGSENVYFQPASNIQIRYPCIVYQRDTLDTRFANNGPYKHAKRYSVTSIDRNPDSLTVMKLAALPMCTYNRFFIADTLNHDVFTLYF